jgi:S-DNA-T family DNA segregation ATPase FtsK/SpoIIIE
MQRYNDNQQHNQTCNKAIRQRARAEENRIRLKFGVASCFRSISKAVTAIVYIIFSSVLWIYRETLIPIPSLGEGLKNIYSLLLKFGIPLLSICFFLLLLLTFGMPIGTRKVQSGLFRVGLVNHAGQSPLLIKRYKVTYKNFKAIALEFAPVGIPLEVWEKNRAAIESITHLTCLSISSKGHFIKIIAILQKSHIRDNTNALTDDEL